MARPPEGSLRVDAGRSLGWVVAHPISSLDGVHVRDRLLHDVSQRLDTAGVAHVALRAGPAQSARLAIEARDFPTLCAVLASLPSAETHWVRIHSDTSTETRSAVEASRLVATRASEIAIGRHYCSVGGRYLATSGADDAVVEIWSRLRGGEERADGEPFLPGTRLSRGSSTTVPYLIDEHWSALSRGEEVSAPALSRPHLMVTREPIDVVYTWVDGDDPQWLARKSEATGVETPDIHRTADSLSRYASRDELRYSLRSLELYAPWVRHIYVVTDRQRPVWLVDDHPRLSIVDHTEIFADPTVLPVYNSHAIESQLHHISGLSDRYLYMNDDVFFGRAVRPELFFSANGVSHFFLSKALLDVSPRSSRDLPVLSAAKRNAELIAETFGAAVTQKFKHTPHPQSRLVLREMEDRFPELFAEVASSRLRHPDDYSIPSSLQHYYSYAIGKAVPGPIRYDYIGISAEESELALDRLLRERDRDVFCLNDTDADEAGHQRAERLSEWFLERYFPVPSTFERVSR